MKNKRFWIGLIGCMIPYVIGILLYNQMPDTMAIHFNIYNEPDNFASKGFVVFGMPFFMVLLQIVCCIINDINAHKYGERKKIEQITKWIIPVMTIVLQTVTLVCGLGIKVDIRKVAAIIVGVVFLLIGNYLPKFDYIKNYDIDTQKARKINRFIGFETVVMGGLMLVSIFLPPIATVVCLFLLIPYAVVGVIYGIKVGRCK